MSAPLRPPAEVMRLARMGAAHPTRLSFMRQLLRRAAAEGWRFAITRFDVDADGYGTAVLQADTGVRCCSLVAFTHAIPDNLRSDRVIADVWDATFSLFDGVPAEADIDRLRANTPRQEGGRFLPSELVLARANKSVRLFAHVVDRLAAGQQPDPAQLAAVGYLMRTTAVYGSGKFGCADRLHIAHRPELAAPFQAEMLAVYLIRWLTIELANHVARARGGARAARLSPALARYLGVGNSTGLGMAPFLIKYPLLVNNWVMARETALARVLAQQPPAPGCAARFAELLEQAQTHARDWHSADAVQSARIDALRADLAALADWLRPQMGRADLWQAVMARARQTCALEAQEQVVSLLLEPQGALIDDLAATMAAPDPAPLNPRWTVAQASAALQARYGWALALDLDDPAAQARFWYYSEDKLEPRLGLRATDPHADREMPLAIARDMQALAHALVRWAPQVPLAQVVLAEPALRGALARLQALADAPFAEVQDNLLQEDARPIDLLRFKLAFFGVSRFDPRSDLWLRVAMFQGAPLPPELAAHGDEGWLFPQLRTAPA